MCGGAVRRGICEHCCPPRIVTQHAELVRRFFGDGVRVFNVVLRLPEQRCYGAVELLESLAADAALESSDEDPIRTHTHSHTVSCF